MWSTWAYQQWWGCERFTHLALFMAPHLSHGSWHWERWITSFHWKLKTQEPWTQGKTSCLWKWKKNLPKPCNEHSTHLTLASPFTPTQDLLVYSNTKWEVASMWLEYQFSWTSQYFKILHIKILTYIWWSWFKDNSKPWNWGLWIQGRFSCWQIRLFRVCCQPLLVLWRAGFLIHGNCFNSFEG